MPLYFLFYSRSDLFGLTNERTNLQHTNQPQGQKYRSADHDAAAGRTALLFLVRDIDVHLALWRDLGATR